MSNTNRALHVFLMPATHAEQVYLPKIAEHRPAPVMTAERVAQIPAHPEYDLNYSGGKIIPDLVFTLFYIGGESSWTTSDRQNIDRAISAAMSDRRLNNVMVQYFPSGSITSTFRPSTVLAGSKPSTVSQSDAEQILTNLHQQGHLNQYDLTRTVFGLVLPSGTVLTDDTTSGGQGVRSARAQRAEGDKAVSSLEGLGGYHGEVQVGGATIYYAIVVYGEHMSNGQDNGIPAFSEPWKNVVAAMYHELNEARTDADIYGTPGWISNPIAAFGGQQVEVGDAPVFEAGNNLGLVFQEIQLADGSGTAPVQFMWSNAVHGPEGPRDTPAPPSPTSGNGSGGGIGSGTWGLIIAAIVIILAIIAGFFILHH